MVVTFKAVILKEWGKGNGGILVIFCDILRGKNRPSDGSEIPSRSGLIKNVKTISESEIIILCFGIFAFINSDRDWQEHRERERGTGNMQQHVSSWNQTRDIIKYRSLKPNTNSLVFAEPLIIKTKENNNNVFYSSTVQSEKFIPLQPAPVSFLFAAFPNPFSSLHCFHFAP